MIIFIVFIVIKYVLGLLMPFIIGFIVALLLKPVIDFTSEKLHVHKKAVAVVLILLFYGVAGFFVSWIGLRFLAELKDGIIKLPEIYAMDIELAVGLSILKVAGAITIAALIAVIDILPVLGTGGVVVPCITKQRI